MDSYYTCTTRKKGGNTQHTNFKFNTTRNKKKRLSSCPFLSTQTAASQSALIKNKRTGKFELQICSRCGKRAFSCKKVGEKREIFLGLYVDRTQQLQQVVSMDMNAPYHCIFANWLVTRRCRKHTFCLTPKESMNVKNRRRTTARLLPHYLYQWTCTWVPQDGLGPRLPYRYTHAIHTLEYT